VTKSPLRYRRPIIGRQDTPNEADQPLIDLVRLLARQAARVALKSNPENQANGDETEEAD
jgi:hypothetical protein